MKYLSITTELLVEDMKKTLDFYTNILNFNVSLSMPQTDPFFAIINSSNVQIMLYTKDKFSEEIPKFRSIKMGASVALFIEVDNIDELYTRIKSKVEIIQEIHTTSYGTKEFSINDCNGYVLMFNQKIKI